MNKHLAYSERAPPDIQPEDKLMSRKSEEGREPKLYGRDRPELHLRITDEVEEVVIKLRKQKRRVWSTASFVASLMAGLVLLLSSTCMG